MFVRKTLVFMEIEQFSLLSANFFDMLQNHDIVLKMATRS